MGGISDSSFEGFFSVFRLLGPFANELANVVTITLPINLYPHHTANFLQNVEKTLIDTIAIMGIMSNVAYYSQATGYESIGFMKGALLLIFSFCAPNLFMGDLLHVRK